MTPRQRYLRRRMGWAVKWPKMPRTLRSRTEELRWFHWSFDRHYPAYMKLAEENCLRLTGQRTL